MFILGLNQSLWLDEGTTAKVVAHYSLFDIITKFSPTDFHPPLYYLMMKIWTSFFGTSEVALRLPSVIFTLLAGYMVYLIVKSLKNREAGFWAAALFVFNPLIVYYSQEARMYMMATFLMSAALYFYLKLLKSNKFKLPDIIFCNLFIFLSFMTFYGSAFFISALYVYLFIKKRWKLFTFVHPGFLLSVLILLPLIIHQLSNAHAALATVKNWSQVLGKATLKNLFLFPLKFSLGRISWEPKKLYYFTGVIWTAFVFLLTWLSGKRNQLFAFLFVFPIGLGIIFSVFSPLLQYFRFIYLIIPLSILLALFSYNKWYRYILIGGFIVFSSLYIFFPQFHREDWKSLALNISQPVYAIPSSMDAFTYYRPDVKINSLFAVDKANEKIITVIPYSADIYGFDYRSVLLKNGYRNTKTIAYRGLTVETYTR